MIGKPKEDTAGIIFFESCKDTRTWEFKNKCIKFLFKR